MRRRLPSVLAATAVLVSTWGFARAQAPQSSAGAPPPLRQNTLHQGDLKLAPDPNAFKRPKRDIMLKDGDLVRGSSAIAAAWFSEPSNRYRSSPFDTDLHPTALTVSTPQHRVLKFRLPKDSVFEDRTPRLVDLDGDGREEIVVVRSYEFKGSALAVLAVRGIELDIIAETPALGAPFQWLNPIGFADFDGDGRMDIALVATPHTKGVLQIWTFNNGQLELVADVEDVSNHVRGSRQMRLAAIADFNGDGKPDIAVPSQDRRRLRFFTLSRGQIDELGEARLAAPAAEDFEVVSVDGRPAVKVGAAGGRSSSVVPCRDISDWEQADGSC